MWKAGGTKHTDGEYIRADHSESCSLEYQPVTEHKWADSFEKLKGNAAHSSQLIKNNFWLRKNTKKTTSFLIYISIKYTYVIVSVVRGTVLVVIIGTLGFLCVNVPTLYQPQHILSYSTESIPFTWSDFKEINSNPDCITQKPPNISWKLYWINLLAPVVSLTLCVV